MRFDSVGMFWADAAKSRKRGQSAPRPMPPIPDTGWVAPAFPNLSSASCLSFDLETYDPELNEYGPGWGRGKGHIVGFSVGADGGGRWYFPIRHEIEPETNLDPGHALAWLRDTLSDPRQAKIGANLLYDIGWLLHEGINVAGELVDVQFAEALLDERALVDLETLSQKYLGEGKQVALLQKWIKDFYAPPDKLWRRDIYRSPPRLAGPYGEGDADLPMRLAPILGQRLMDEGLFDIFRMECELIPLLVQMRMAGVSVDIKAAEQLRDTLIIQSRDEQKQLDALVGAPVDIDSAATIARAFDKFGIPYGRTPTGKPSFTKDFFKTVKHPIAGHIQKIRKYEKFRGTFVEGYILDSNVNGKIYCSFHPLRGEEGGTRSGRFSSSDPNLQNIPIRDQILGPATRRIFIPDPGHESWRKYDYSQIEYRFLIHYAVGPGADEARERFNRYPDTDYHEMIQTLIKEHTGELMDRRPIKNLNFGLVFGMGKDKLARSTGMELAKAKKFIDIYDKAVPFAKPTMKAYMDEANNTGVIKTVLGRRSRFDLWEPDSGYGKSDDKKTPALPYELAIRRYGKIRRGYIHKALNRLLQGSAADLMKVAMHRCWKDGVFAYTGVPRLTVHDELDFSDPGGNDEAFAEMNRIMETAIPLRIPVKAGLDRGANWGDAKGA